MLIKYQIIGRWSVGIAYFNRYNIWYLFPEDCNSEDYTFDTLDDAKDAFVEAVQRHDFLSNVHIIALMGE